MNIEYYVAPYEADAQLAYLSRIKYVNLVITEDSDLLVYNCDRVLFHLDSNGWGFEISMKELHLCKELNFSSFTEEMFIQTCILSGCDYIESITGIGLKTGHSLIAKHRDYKEVLRNLTINPKYVVPKNYLDGFEKAFLTFNLQLIYCPIKKKIVHLNDVMKYKKELEKYDDISFLGKNLKKEIVERVVSGDVDPNTLIPFDNEENEIENDKNLEIDKKQTTLNSFLQTISQSKSIKKNSSKKIENKANNFSKNDRLKNKRKPSDFSKTESTLSNYLNKKKYREEFFGQDNEEEIINLAYQEFIDVNLLSGKQVSSDFECDEVENKSIKECLAKTNEKTVIYSSSFESGSFNFDEYKYKEDDRIKCVNYFNNKKMKKNKMNKKGVPTPKKIFGILQQKNNKSNPKPCEIIDLNDDSNILANFDFESYYNKE